MNTNDVIKLQAICKKILTPDNIALVRYFSYIHGEEIHEPEVYVNMEEVRALLKLAKMKDDISIPIKDMPERNYWETKK